jgi:type II secretory pathway pseudopilin PulG
MPAISTVDFGARRRSSRRPPQRDRGETLIELLMTVLILGTAVVAVVGALAVAIRVSDVHRKQATAGAAVRAFAEALEQAVAQAPSGYQPCGSEQQYEGLYTPPPGYLHDVDPVIRVWDGAGFTAAATPCNDQGVQLVSLRVSTDGGQISESLDVVLRLPCRPEVDACGAS